MSVVEPLRATVRVARNSVRSMLGRPDYKRWSSTGGLEGWWDARTQAIAAMIPAGSRVIEFGAGRRQLEKFLPSGCSYTPSDLVDRGPGTIVCDLNKQPLPDIKHLNLSVAVFGGVLEYVADVDALLAWLSASGIQICIASFDAVPEGLWMHGRVRHHFRRRYFGYMNNLSEVELNRAFAIAHMTCVEKRQWTTQGIYRFDKQHSDKP